MSAEMLEIDVEEMSPSAARRAFDGQARARLGVSGAQFLAGLDAGEYDDDPREDVLALRIMAPFGR